MAWNMHYAGEKIGALGDESYESIRGQINLINSGEATGWIHFETSSRKIELVYTPGVPIYFSYFNENAEIVTANSVSKLDVDLG